MLDCQQPVRSVILWLCKPALNIFAAMKTIISIPSVAAGTLVQERHKVSKNPSLPCCSDFPNYSYFNY